jgi:hypothetical protein
MDSTVLNKFLEQMGEMLKEAKDFSLEQLPIVAKEILQYHLAVDLGWLGFALLLTLASLVVIFWFTRLIKAEGPRGMENYWGMYLIPGLMNLISFIIFVNEGRDALMIWLAPRVYLLEYISRLLPHTH